MDIPASQSIFPAILQSGALVTAATSAFFGIKAYRQNTKTKTGEFLTRLHQSFFVDQTYKKVRDALDESSKPELAEALVAEEGSDFTDFLNFFEFVAYMQKCGNLSAEDVEVLLGYYLRILANNVCVYRYICNEKNGFEQLKKLLTGFKLKEIK